MPLFLYIPRQSPLHRLHPTVKVLGMLCLFIAAFVGQRPLLLLPIALLVIALILWAGALPNVRRLRVLFALVFVMTLVIWTLFFRGGVPWFVWGPIHVSRTGSLFALGMAIKLTTFLGAGVVFLSITRIEEFAFALTRLGLPYKLGFTMTLAFRLVPVFLDAALSVIQAQRCRGFDFEAGSLWQRARRYVPVIVPVFMTALRRADGMAMALEARGFQSSNPRSVFGQWTFRSRDAAALALAALLVVGSLALWLQGYTALPAS